MGCRNDQSLLPTKFSGVTMTIAIACPTSLPARRRDEQVEHEEVRAERNQRDDEEAHPLRGTPRRRSRNVHRRFHV